MSLRLLPILAFGFTLSSTLILQASPAASGKQAQHLPQKTRTQKTDLQMLLTPRLDPAKRNETLVRRHDLVRLWPLNSAEGQAGPRTLIEDVATPINFPGVPVVMSRYGVRSELELDHLRRIRPQTCQDQTFAYFDGAAFYSHETGLIKGVLNETRYSTLDRWNRSLHEKVNLLRERGYLDKHGKVITDQFNDPIHTPQLRRALENPAHRKSILHATSLVSSVEDTQTPGQYLLTSSDYTLGGWFQPRWTGNKGRITLFKKFFTNVDAPHLADAQVEWEIFATGNNIYFHNYRDYYVKAVMKYHSDEQADLIRHDLGYLPGEYYQDVVDRVNPPTVMPSPFIVGSGNASEQNKIIFNGSLQASDMVPHKSRKPIPPPEIHPPGPQPPPPVIVVPRPPRPPFWEIGAGATGKEYTIGAFDMKSFWHSTNLGLCYGCVLPSKHHHVWYYFAVSVHMNDPLGPYIDLYLIQDPQERIFGHRATMQSHYRKVRIELGDKEKILRSRPLITPITHNYRTEAKCESSDFCTRSILQIGAGSPTDGPYRGYMRGVYLAKKALREDSVVEMAREYRPIDACGMTYDF